MGNLDGKVAFITGVARGQGRSHAVTLAKQGAAIIGVDICADIASNPYPMASRDELDETVALVEAAGGKMLGSVADVRDFHAVKSALDAGVEQFGRLDIVLANAGVAPTAFREVTIEEDLEMWNDAVGVNLVGSFHTAKAAIPHLIAGGRGGSIVFTSSTAGLRGFGGMQGGGLGYAASKHGIVGLMRTLSNALAPHSIRVNTVHPTAVNTMMAVNPAMTAFLENYPDGGPHLQNPMPVSLLEPEDISATISYLVSDAAKYVTGVTLPVDAGFTNKL
ncbi:mycofactocin-coupled SDR family oxidoreductase [Mycolicibacterium fortuitum]|jgi:SDR family mycofactocin-dependent oxidoreductase|uniref:Mycofactocin-coupled SDR family oxidoreductase n=2 Tax=Mycolicibacterium fortuitum TaxID=1766 RepID=A0A0N9XYA6_MYCFO|nr:mycofactocin-coupled SDR family oxidoreductase [Mycolicibacterium fortuitum]ALI29138.1 oxidoreductase, short chain dehydrogenase-reductase family [Mycolicibacterium fortuitum]MCV7140919.1 mycofactocin-coupled SDR family oxidoreductase [Mycolicibacterium fortuitum]MDV7192724.1 mycofactocin-coupled SDR family oxidoreductase [Mycolicibacterium fortuitum]MDV7205748.1 mycofactocin-coupled SDR family oxidoreductase [Mycolicibacterium fortuitum]MDV7229306.1 mycofactocin-coupled SDR family oxidored